MVVVAAGEEEKKVELIVGIEVEVVVGIEVKVMVMF
jgi:hypothetical protein